MIDAIEPRRVLAFCDYYLPGFKAGGPVTTLRNLVACLSDRMSFHIVTRDRDLGDACPYPAIVAGDWTSCGPARVLYLPPEEVGYRRVCRIVAEVAPTTIYLNSLLSRRFSLIPLIAVRRAAPSARVVLAPRGELAPAALALKRRRKRAYLTALQAAGLLRGLIWQASSSFEAADIRGAMGENAVVEIAPDLTALPPAPAPRVQKRAGEARFVFLGRVSPMKNLVGGLRSLEDVSGDVAFDVHGPMEDEDYVAECRKAIASLPSSVRVRLLGPLPPNRVHETVSQADALFLPSLGENFAQVVPEALAAGCPVVVSDQTPWRGLEAIGVGFDRPLSPQMELTDALQRIVDMDEGAHAQMRAAARAYAERLAGDDEARAASARLLCGG